MVVVDLYIRAALHAVPAHVRCALLPGPVHIVPAPGVEQSTLVFAALLFSTLVLRDSCKCARRTEVHVQAYTSNTADSFAVSPPGAWPFLQVPDSLFLQIKEWMQSQWNSCTYT